jgi:hypothetical protein
MSVIVLQRVAKPAPLFEAWMNRAKVAVTDIPPLDVTDHFDRLYQLEEVPSILVQVSIPCPHIYHSQLLSRVL